MSVREKRGQLITVAAVCLLIIMLVALTINVVTIFRLKARQEELRKKLSELDLTAERIDNELESRSDKDYIEKYARENLELTEDGEIVYVPKK